MKIKCYNGGNDMKEKFALWSVLFSQYVKRDWKKMIVWIIGLGLFSGGFVPAFEEIGKGQGLIGMFETMQNPAMVAMVGPTAVTTATEYTIGAMYANEMLLFCCLFAMIVSILHVISHTRKEEELGLTELVRSFRVGRQANSLAVMIETVIINLGLSLCTSILMIFFNVTSITVEGSLLFGLSIGIAGMIAATIALVFAQIMPTSSGATGASLGMVGLLYIIRATTDVSNINLSMVNPMGWTYLTYPFTENNWLPLIFGLLFSCIVIVFAFVLEEKRDMGAGYLPEKEGRATAKKSLLSVPGLFVKINKGVIISWLVAFVIMGAAYGAIYGDMQTFLESNELMKQMFTLTGVSIEVSFTATIMMVLIELVTILPIAVVNKLFNEEVRLHLSQLYSTKVTRGQFYWVTIVLAVIVGVVGIVFAAGGLGATAISVMSKGANMNIADFLVAGLNYLPSVLFFIGLAALALGWIPKLGKVVYAYLGYSFVLNYFGGILDLPDWFSKTAIQSWIPRMPTEGFDGTIFIVMTLLSISLMLIGYLGYKKRDMLEGA